MNTPTSFKAPTTYRDFVEDVEHAYRRRLAELKRAEKLIRAIENDLRTLSEQHRLYVDHSDYTMHLVNCAEIGARSQWGLRLRFGLFSSSSDRAVRALISLGWTFERTRTPNEVANVVLRKPKSQVRVVLDGSAALVDSLLNPEATCN
ncbi:hypothetical protein WL58_17890 [Burkholderia cepacia]|uniref:hypothetical protein n=1 Tax=Burkholderia cepacia TaxID=292 RepID=UPI000759D7A4|nr:hypothetical protein [Burkholderia cepacia]KWC82743.1 hypothetical protein WL58_17890 [Burkholderia cepacia]